MSSCVPIGMTVPDEPAPPPSRRRRRLPGRKASEVLVEALRGLDAAEISVAQLVRAIGDRAFGLVLVLFALPNCVPAPPGLGSIVGLPLMLFGIQLVLGRRTPWLPRFIGRRRFRRQTVLTMIERGLPYIQRLERVCRPRLTALADRRVERIHGAVITILAAAILIPLPLTNFIPAIGIGVIALGLLEEDGLAILVGTIIGSIGLSIVAGVLIGTYQWIFV